MLSTDEKAAGEDLFKPLYKAHRRSIKDDALVNVFDPMLSTEEQAAAHGFRLVHSTGLHDALRDAHLMLDVEATNLSALRVWESTAVPGFVVCAGAVAPDVQTRFAAASTGAWLSDKRHLTNLDLHGVIDRPLQLFPDSHGLQTKLRWTTLGGQYDWTRKVYPSWQPGSELCPEMPRDLSGFCRKAFGHQPQAAIVNYYREGDVLMPHQDVAEKADAVLASLSLGCECIFYAGKQRRNAAPHAILLRSGDAIMLSGEGRAAWHGVGRVFCETAPQWLLNCPESYDYWRKTRVNISVRQMLC